MIAIRGLIREIEETKGTLHFLYRPKELKNEK